MWEGVLCRRIIDYNTHEARLQVVCPTQQRKEVWEKHRNGVGTLGGGEDFKLSTTTLLLARHADPGPAIPLPVSPLPGTKS